MPDTKWKYKAEYFENCNCDYGCTCNFDGFPSKGNCRAVIALRVLEGSCGDVDLAGAISVMAVAWPSAIHEGNGKAAVFFDPSMSQEQVGAMAAILTNEYGGLPHEIIAGTITEVLGPFVEPIQINFDGTKSNVTIGDKVRASMTPHVSPVDASEEQEVHVVLPTGFVWQDAQAARTIKQSVSVDGLAFEDSDTNAFYSVVEHSN